MGEHRIDGFGLDFGEKTDAAQIDSEHRCGGAARQFRRPQKGTVATQDQHQFTAGRRVLIGVDDFDIDTQGTELGRIQVHRSAIDSLGRQHPQRYTVLPQCLGDTASGLCHLVAAGVCDKQNFAFVH
ncbi:Uncharacterised protein [Mycobacteroides abscessus]|nr:Uncharacterised protein [Mycobacteroides abscessus]